MTDSETGLTKSKRRKVEEGHSDLGATTGPDYDEGELRRKIAARTINVPKHQDPKLVHHLDGHYIIRQSHTPFASGGFCDVFIGDHPEHGKVAMRRPRMTMEGHSPSQVTNFCIEAEIWKKLRHPNILQFIGLIQSDGHVWAVSRFAENGPLPRYLKAHPETDRRMLMVQLADAIAYLHRQGVVHGDIKGSNILISAVAAVLLCDFGLSKLFGTSTVSSLEGATSIRWCAPEVLFDGETKSYASDVWSFGMTVYEILSGNMPYHDVANDFTVINAIKEGRRPPREPAFSGSGESYEPLWEIASASWDDKPSHRPSMDTTMERLRVTVAASCGTSDMEEPSVINATDFGPASASSSTALILHSSLPFNVPQTAQSAADATLAGSIRPVTSDSIGVGSDSDNSHIPFELFEQKVKNIRPPLGARLIDPSDFSIDAMDEPVNSYWPGEFWCPKCSKFVSSCWHHQSWWSSVVPTEVGKVKRLVKIYSSSAGAEKAFLSDLEFLGQLMHKHLLHIKGFSYTGSMPFMVLSPGGVQPLKVFLQTIWQQGSQNNPMDLLKSMSEAWKASCFVFGESPSRSTTEFVRWGFLNAVTDERGRLLLSFPEPPSKRGSTVSQEEHTLQIPLYVRQFSPWMVQNPKDLDARLMQAALHPYLQSIPEWVQSFSMLEKSARDDMSLLLYRICNSAWIAGSRRVRTVLEAYRPGMDLTSAQHLLFSSISSRHHLEHYPWPADAVDERVRSRGAYDLMFEPGDVGYFVQGDGNAQSKRFVKLENISREIGKVEIVVECSLLVKRWMDHTGNYILSQPAFWDLENKRWVVPSIMWQRRLGIIAKITDLLRVCQRVAMKYDLPASKIVIVRDVQSMLIREQRAPDNFPDPSGEGPTFCTRHSPDGQLIDWYWSSSPIPGVDRLTPPHPEYQATDSRAVIDHAILSGGRLNAPRSMYIPVPTRLDEELLDKGLLPREEGDPDDDGHLSDYLDDECGLLDAASRPIRMAKSYSDRRREGFL